MGNTTSNDGPMSIRSSPNEEDLINGKIGMDEKVYTDMTKDMMPCVFRWPAQGNNVYLAAKFLHDWNTKVKLHRSGNDLYTIQWVPKYGNQSYKFLVDGEWKTAPNQLTTAESGYTNNYINLEKFVSLEDEDRLMQETEKKKTEAQFNEYHNPPGYADFAGDPPVLPPYLRQIILNKPSKDGVAKHLCSPSHVTINHLYCRSLEIGMVITGSTVRYDKKFVTTIYFNYTPKN
ncbi:hypothetical protein WA158_003063 [Blastocystis sp. Blastoise]